MTSTLHAWRSLAAKVAARPLMMSLVLVSLLSFAANQARAVVTYSYSGSHSLTWTDNSSRYLTLARTGGSTSLTVHAFLTGSSKFTLGSTSLTFPDSSKDTSWNMSRYFEVQFASNVADTCLAWLVIYDNNHSDTIALTGYGSYTYPKTFEIYDTLVRINVTRLSGGVQSSGYAKVYNISSDTIRLWAVISDSENFELNGAGLQTLSIPDNSDAGLVIHYIPNGEFVQYTYVTVGEFSAPYRQAQITVIVVDSAYAPAKYQPRVSATDLGIVALLDSACGTVTISNPNAQPITLTGIRADSIGWSASGKPSLPLTLYQGDSTMFSVCYHSNGNDYGLSLYDNIYINFRDSSGKTGSLHAYAHAQVSGAIDVIRDSLILDDVVLGGFVEATAIYVAHMDTTLSVGIAMVSGGGQVQVISPSLPLSVHSGDTINLRLRITPGDSTSQYYGYLPVHFGGWTDYVRFSGKTVIKTSNDSAHGLALYPQQNELIALQTSNSTVIDTFWFTNNYNGNVTVNNATLSSGAHFSILGYVPSSLPYTLSYSHSIGIIVKFSGDTLGFYHDSLYIDASHSLLSQPIDLEVMLNSINGSNAGVAKHSVANGLALSVSPNPANGPVGITVDGARTANIEVYDLLGGRVMSMPNTMDASWNADATIGGAYIVRASGTDATGAPFSITKRLILVH